MRRTHRIALAILAACSATLLVTAPATASRSIGFSEIRLRETGVLTFSGEEERSFATVCNVTLTGTLVARAGKVARSQIGSVTEGRTSGCRGSEEERVTFQAEGFPWQMTYSGFSGTLPNIAAVRVIRQVEFRRTSIVFTECRYRGPVNAIRTSTELTWEQPNAVPKIEGIFLCPRTSSINGTKSLPMQRMTLV